ncbi:37S ribosomal protein S24, mitochondrial [Ceratocystis pirilliformis]|uniref:37S ribosomal protein S24, mitochondrial n=1 Tax=Ceratocystis pirilliformis TaxID=259994 RepID=A0ABR3YIM9_9PEZI
MASAASSRSLRPLLRFAPTSPSSGIALTQRALLSSSTVRSADSESGSGPTKKRALTEPVDRYVVNKKVSAEETVQRWPEELRSAFVNGENGLAGEDLSELTRALDRLGDGVIENPVRSQEPMATPRSYWFDPDDPETLTHSIEGDKFEENDISPLAHAKLQELREEREYMRVMAWEMPLLAKFAKEFTPPSPSQVLRFRYATYMGEEHPAQSKVVVEFSTADLGLTPVQQRKLAKLAGPRYNPQTHLIKMSCESYPHQAQNKRFLSDQVDRLVAEAKDPKETFEDIPLDTRHHKYVSNPKWPKEWTLTKKRRAQLAAERRKTAAIDASKEVAGAIVDGNARIEQFLLENTGIAPWQVGADVQVKMPELASISPSLVATGRTGAASKTAPKPTVASKPEPVLVR